MARGVSLNAEEAGWLYDQGAELKSGRHWSLFPIGFGRRREAWRRGRRAIIISGMPTETNPVDPTDRLNTPEAIEEFLDAAAETGDMVYQGDCWQIAARVRERWGFENSDD
jgi:hypothetical protein